MKRAPSERVMIERAIQIVGSHAKTVRAMALRGEIPGAARIGKRRQDAVKGEGTTNHHSGWICAPSTRDPANIERAVVAFARRGNGGMIVTASTSSVANRDLIIALAARYKMPAVYHERGL
jgi:hypothetical protein